jgi:hypothetical protein
MIKPPNMGVFSALGVIRTRGPLLRKQMLYPLSYEGVFFL